jgi:hypothetical protein
MKYETIIEVAKESYGAKLEEQNEQIVRDAVRGTTK